MSGIENKSRVNFNLSHQILLKAAKDFEGYLTGLSRNNVISFFGDDIEVKNYLDSLSANKQGQAERDFMIIKDELVPAILDRTTGCYLTKDLFYLNQNLISNIAIPKSLNEYLTIVYSPDITPETGKKDNITYFQETMPISKDIVGNKRSLSTNDAIKNIHFSKAERTNLTTIDDNGISEDVLKDPSDPFSDPKEYYSGILFEDGAWNDTKKILDSQLNLNNSPDRYKSPHMASYVIKDSRLSINRKNVNHLPVFFNAIPPIEMSRCTPYLDIKVVSRKFKNDSLMSNVKSFRFIDSENNYDDSIDFGNMKLVNDDFKEFNENSNISLMDIFTSPQTMSNADINKSSSNDSQTVLDPIMPLMSLKSLDVKISGKGYGIMSSKVATLSLVLHDRSRLPEIAPLVASNQIAGTKIIIEYGWNHPEGGVDSENVIGQYLNALKDMSIYQVIKSDYSFQGSSININISLAASGFKKSERVHVGSGPVVPGNVLEEIIDESINAILIEKKDDNGTDIKEVRQKIKMTGSNARDIYSNFTWKEYRELVETLNKTTPNKQLLVSKVKDVISKIASGGTIKDSSIFSNLANLDEFEKKGTMIGNVYSKLEYFENSEFRDPFVYCYIKGSKASVGKAIEKNQSHEDQKSNYVKTIYEDNGSGTNPNTQSKYVTLGSVLNTFVGYPMASTCIFDEVQMVFHPINHQAGAARKYTLANFPIELKKLREVIEMSIKKNSRLTINSFLNILERKIIRDRNSVAYGLNYEYTNLSVLTEKKDDKDKINSIVAIIKVGHHTGLGYNPGGNQDDEDFSKLVDSYTKDDQVTATKKLTSGKSFKKRALELYKNQRAAKENVIRTSITDSLKRIYDSDGLNDKYPAKHHLTVPNLTLDYEVVPAIVGSNSSDEYQELGVSLEKTILRIHVYDQESIASPSDAALLSAKIGGIDNQFDEKISEIASKMTFNEIKDTIKRSYPTINYGSSTGTINSVSSQANSHGKLANVLMVESYKNIETADTIGKSYSVPYEDITMFPNTVTVECAGMPMIGRGNNIFIDFGTNTTLDNIYTVKDISHKIESGKFSTNISLVPGNIKSVSSFRVKLADLAKKL